MEASIPTVPRTFMGSFLVPFKGGKYGASVSVRIFSLGRILSIF
jgi:hypothetical protein